MRQQWHAAVVQVAPPDLEDLYLCAALSCCKLDIPLCTPADISLGENILIHGVDTKAAQKDLGYDVNYCEECGDNPTPSFRHIVDYACYLNVLIPAGVVPSRVQYLVDEIGCTGFGWFNQFDTIIDRLDANEYLWVRLHLFVHRKPSLYRIQGFL